MQNFKNKRPNKIYIPYNDRIKATHVRCIDSSNENIGVLPIMEAIDKAFSEDLDLVQISEGKDGIPVCKITDFGKFKFEFQKKQKETAKKQREAIIKVKEIKLRPSTEDNDLKIKAEKANEFINDGDKVKIFIVFRGREMAHKELGYETLNKFLSFIPEKNVYNQSFQGKILSTMIEKKAK